jgi:hypothetical protein
MKQALYKISNSAVGGPDSYRRKLLDEMSVSMRATHKEKHGLVEEKLGTWEKWRVS